MDEPGKGLGFFGAFASTLVGFEGRFGRTGWFVGPPDMDDEADQDENDHEKLVQQQVWLHDDVPLHRGERRLFYRIPLSNYPLDTGTLPLSTTNQLTDSASNNHSG